MFMYVYRFKMISDIRFWLIEIILRFCKDMKSLKKQKSQLFYQQNEFKSRIAENYDLGQANYPKP